MKSWSVKILFVIGCFVATANTSFAQDTKDINARSPKEVPHSRLEKKALKKKDKQKEKLDKAIEIGRKRHEKLQEREVRKRMKKSKHTASLNNAHKREFFLKRWFRRKQHTKNR